MVNFSSPLKQPTIVTFLSSLFINLSFIQVGCLFFKGLVFWLDFLRVTHLFRKSSLKVHFLIIRGKVLIN